MGRPQQTRAEGARTQKVASSITQICARNVSPKWFWAILNTARVVFLHSKLWEVCILHPLIDFSPVPGASEWLGESGPTTTSQWLPQPPFIGESSANSPRGPTVLKSEVLLFLFAKLGQFSGLTYLTNPAPLRT